MNLTDMAYKDRATPFRQIRALYDEQTVRVYQTYSDTIADSLLANGRFVEPPFKMNRMTWAKPSYLWMMYRCGWSYKDDSQCRVFAFDITREGFEWALAHSCSSHPKGLDEAAARELMEGNPVRVQWDLASATSVPTKVHQPVKTTLRQEYVGHT